MNKQAIIAKIFTAFFLLSWAFRGVLAAPNGPTVTFGSVNIAQTSNNSGGTNTTMNQGSFQAIINWNGFGSNMNEIIQAIQPSQFSALLNRVTGGSPSNLMGTLTANGRIFIINPNGILFGASSRVNVGGLFASTLALNDQDFLNNNLRFFQNGQTASVVNQGVINGGPENVVALIGPIVNNSGTITNFQGTTVLAAVNQATLAIDPNTGVVTTNIDSASQVAGQPALVNTGTIEGNGPLGSIVNLLSDQSILLDSGSVVKVLADPSKTQQFPFGTPNITISAVNDITTNGSTVELVARNGNMNVNAGGNISSNNSTFSIVGGATKFGSMTFNAGGNFNAAGSTFTNSFGDSIRITAGTVSLSNSNVQGGHSEDIGITARTGDINLLGTTLSQSQADDINVTAAGNVNVTNSSIVLDHAGNINVNGGNSVTFTGSHVGNSLGGNTTIATPGALTFSNSNVAISKANLNNYSAGTTLTIDNSNFNTTTASNSTFSGRDIVIRNNSNISNIADESNFFNATNSLTVDTSTINHTTTTNNSVFNSGGSISLNNATIELRNTGGTGNGGHLVFNAGGPLSLSNSDLFHFGGNFTALNANSIAFSNSSVTAAKGIALILSTPSQTEFFSEANGPVTRTSFP